MKRAPHPGPLPAVAGRRSNDKFPLPVRSLNGERARVRGALFR